MILDILSGKIIVIEGGLFFMVDIVLDEKKLKAVVGKKLKKIAEELFTISQDNIKKMGVHDTGELLQSGEVRKTEDGYSVGYSAPYAVYQNRGVGKAIGHGTFMPPLGDENTGIMGWVWRNRGMLNASAYWTGKGIKITEKTLRKVAFLVARKIGQEGFLPKPFFTNAVDRIKDEYS